MAIISSYPVVQPSAGDYLVGTKVENTGVQVNPTKNFTVEAVGDLILGYKSYVALISQAGGADPTAIVLHNNTGVTFTWARTGGGIYTLTASGNIFTAGKTIVFNNNGIDIAGGNTPPQWQRTSDTVITVLTGGIDTAIDNGAFEVRIYS